MNKKSKKEMVEALWLEINQAIINSKGVHDRFNSMKDKDALDYLCEHDFLLDGQKLIEEILGDPNKPDEPENSPEGSFMAFMEKQEQSIPSVTSSLFPKVPFSIN